MKAEAFFTTSPDKPAYYIVQFDAKEVDNMMLHGDDSIVNEVLVELNEEWGKYNEDGKE